MAEEVGYTQFFSYIVRYQSKADASEHIIFYGARDLKDIALSNLLPSIRLSWQIAYIGSGVSEAIFC